MNIDEIKRRVELPDLAERIGLKPGKSAAGKDGSRLFHADESDKTPSLSIFRDKGGERIWRWKDHRTNDTGTCVDLVMRVLGEDVAGAVKYLHEYLGVPLERQQKPTEERRDKSRAEFIADRCLEHADEVIPYLVEQRKLPLDVVKRAIARRTLGFNVWESTKVPAGEVGHGGRAAAFIVRTSNPGHIVAVDLRYLDPVTNGGVKTMSQGEKSGYPWCSDWKRVQAAHTVHVVESAINALSVEAADVPGHAAVATRGTATVEGIDWRFLQGKQVVLGFDNDEPFENGPNAGYCAGQLAAWKLHEILTGLDISALLLDQQEWEWNDVNEILQKVGKERLGQLLQKWEPWVIQGKPALRDEDKPRGRSRLWLPGHDTANYWKYRVRPDFTSVVSYKEEDDGEGKKVKRMEFADLAGFRVAAISRVAIASAVSTMTGDQDAQPKVMFAVSVQTPRHGARLVRRVLEDEKLHNVEVWKKFGPVFNQSQFLRMVNILERTAHLGARNAANFVGLAWRDGKLIVNEGPNCYFTSPEQQCPYHNLTFPSGPVADARTVIKAYQATFGSNAAAMALVWALGGHLKALLGFWPHMIMQAEKGAGKSTLTKRLERTLAMTMFSGQTLNTEFRQLTSLSHTSHPVGWEELSARHQQVIDKAVSLLQEAYQYTISRRGAELVEFLVSAPVLLAGEDVPVKSVFGKVVRTQLKKELQGDVLPMDLPRFPVRQWLEFLATLNRRTLLELYGKAEAKHRELSRASGNDGGAARMAGNYAAVSLAWKLLCEFAELDVTTGRFLEDLVATMNADIKDTTGERSPWVWILETVLSEIDRNSFQLPYAWGKVAPSEPADAPEEDCLLVRTSHVMDHLRHTNALRDEWNSLPIKSDRVFKQELKHAGVVLRDDVERTIGASQYGEGGKRVSHLTAISLQRVRRFGLHVATPTDIKSVPPASSS